MLESTVTVVRTAPLRLLAVTAPVIVAVGASGAVVALLLARRVTAALPELDGVPPIPELELALAQAGTSVIAGILGVLTVTVVAGLVAPIAAAADADPAGRPAPAAPRTVARLVALGACAIAGIAVTAGIGLLLAPRLLAAPASVALEGHGVAASVSRSWHLSRSRYWPHAGVLALVVVVSSAVGGLLSSPVSAAGALLGGTWLLAAQALGAALASVVTTAVSAVVISLVAVDLGVGGRPG